MLRSLTVAALVFGLTGRLVAQEQCPRGIPRPDTTVAMRLMNIAWSMKDLADSAAAIYRLAEGGESENSFWGFRTGAAAVADYATYAAPSYFPAALLAADLAYGLSDRGEGNVDTTWARTALIDAQCVARLAQARGDQTTARQMRDRVAALTQTLRDSRDPSKQ